MYSFIKSSKKSDPSMKPRERLGRFSAANIYPKGLERIYAGLVSARVKIPASCHRRYFTMYQVAHGS